MTLQTRSVRARLLGLLMMFVATTTANAAEITLLSAAAPQGSIVRLGDVARIRRTSPRSASYLASIALMPAPAPGQRIILRRRQILDMLEATGQDLLDHRFEGAQSVEITRATALPSQVVTRTRLTGALVQRLERTTRDALLEYLQVYASATEPWVIEFALSREQQQLLAGAKTPVSVEGGKPPWTGEQHFSLLFTTTAGEQRLELAATISLPSPLIATRRALPRGARIRAADITLRRPQPGETRLTPDAGFTRLEDILGMEVKRALPEGEFVPRSLVQLPILVQRGERVTVYARAAGVQVRTTAVAREAGSQGDLIVVETLANKQRFAARVAAAGEVEVLAQAVSAGRYE